MDHSTLFKMTHLHTLVNCIVKLTKLGEGDKNVLSIQQQPQWVPMDSSQSRLRIQRDEQYDTPPSQWRRCDLNTKPADPSLLHTSARNQEALSLKDAGQAISIQGMPIKVRRENNMLSQCNYSRYWHSPFRVSGSRRAVVWCCVDDTYGEVVHGGCVAKESMARGVR